MTTPEQSASATSIKLSDLAAWQQHSRVLRQRPLRPCGVQGGAHRSPFRGQGIEFDEVRIYQAGDDVNRIDWKVSARTQTTHIKLFREERERPFFMCMDYRPAMFFATRGRLKAVQASHLSALLAWSAISHGDRLGGMIFSANEHHELRPARGRQAVLRWLHQCCNAPVWSNAASHQPYQQQDKALSNAIMRLRHLAHPGTTVMIFSDFRGLTSAVAMQLRALARHCDCLLCWLYDGFESQLPEASSLTAFNGQRKIIIEANKTLIRQHAAKRFIERQQQLQELCQQPSITLLPLTTHAQVLDVARKLYG